MEVELKLEDLEITLKGLCWVAFTNTDCTEGRGYDVPIAVTELEATAIRAAHRSYVQGADGPVRKLPLLRVNGLIYGPVQLVAPTGTDKANQAALDARNAALDKAKAAGLTEDEIRAMSFTPKA